MKAPPPLFYAPKENWESDWILLPKDEGDHAKKVLRLKPGTLIIVIDGQGKAARASLEMQPRRPVMARLVAEIRDFGEPSVHLTLACGLSTGSKFDLVVQQGTELGVSRFVPLLTEKSKVKLDSATKLKTKQRRLEKVALASAKQCRRSFRPEVSLPQRLKEFLSSDDPESLRLIFHPISEAEPLDQVDLSASNRRICLLTGPESGFSEEEIEEAVEAGFRPVSLGQRVLRTQTAGPVAAALMMYRLGQFN